MRCRSLSHNEKSLTVGSTSWIDSETATMRGRPASGIAVERPAPPRAAASSSARPAPAEEADTLALVTYPLLNDGASLLRRAADLNRAAPAAFAELHPDTAAKLGVQDGSTVELHFGEDRSARVPLRVAVTTAPGCVFVPTNQPDLSLGALLGPAATSGAVTVRLEAVTEAAV
jgi:anaerobic selenocysteine-containing dehydrogenase